MDSSGNTRIPNRAETLKVLRLMSDSQPMLMLGGEADGYGARWTLDGSEVQPSIATYLTKSGFIGEVGTTEMGARQLALTAAGAQFRAEGLLWWAGLGVLEKIKVTLLG
jgi:hypothetical protein